MTDEYMDRRKAAIDACKAKGYDETKPWFHEAVDKEMDPHTDHDPCAFCGRPAYARIRGRLQECHGCWKVSSRLSGFVQGSDVAACTALRAGLEVLKEEIEQHASEVMESDDAVALLDWIEGRVA